MPVDLLSDGQWAECASSGACTSQIHLEMTLDEVRHVPHDILETLLESLQPPTVTYGSLGGGANGIAIWQDSEGEPHRDYDLPAITSTDGARVWYRHGVIHRGHDRPAVITSDGDRKWFTDGICTRDGKPAVINHNGQVEYWEHGERKGNSWGAYEPQWLEET